MALLEEVLWCVTRHRPLGFRSPRHFQLDCVRPLPLPSAPLPPPQLVRKDVSSQLVLQRHVCSPSATFLVRMAMDSFSRTVNPNKLFLLYVALVTVSHSNRKVTEAVGSEASKDSGHPQLVLSASCCLDEMQALNSCPICLPPAVLTPPSWTLIPWKVTAFQHRKRKLAATVFTV